MTDLEKMERRISMYAVNMEMEKKFSKEVPRIDGVWNQHFWLTTKYENVKVNREWIDTQDKIELGQIFDKYLQLYLPRHKRNTVSSFLTKEIEWAKNYQSYYTDYERIPSNKTPYYILQDWIDYLEGKKNEGNEIDSVIVDSIDLPAIDIKTQKEQIRLLYELGIIDFLQSRYPATLKVNNNQVADLLGKILKHKKVSIQPTVNALLTDNKNDKNYPKISTNIIAIIAKLDSNESK